MLQLALPDLADAHRDAIVAAYRVHYAETGILMTTLFAGVTDVMQKLVACGTSVYVVTNKPQHAAEAIVRHLGLANLVRRVVGGDPAGLGNKPDRAAALVADEGLTGGVFVGDGLDDLHAAERIGARFFLAGWGYGAARVLAEHPEAAVLQRPENIVPVILEATHTTP
jgi:phosphoglycolate phosphatase